MTERAYSLLAGVRARVTMLEKELSYITDHVLPKIVEELNVAEAGDVAAATLEHAERIFMKEMYGFGALGEKEPDKDRVYTAKELLEEGHSSPEDCLRGVARIFIMGDFHPETIEERWLHNYLVEAGYYYLAAEDLDMSMIHERFTKCVPVIGKAE